MLKINAIVMLFYNCNEPKELNSHQLTSQDIVHVCKALLEKGSHSEAASELSSLLKREPKNFHALQLMGIAKHMNNETELAIEYMEKALSVNAKHFATQHNLAGMYRNIGKMKEAEACYRNAINLKEDYGEAYQGLSEIIRFSVGDPLLDKVHIQLKKTLQPDIAAFFHFSAGKIYDDCKDYENAFKHYSLANQLATSNWDFERHKQQQKVVIETFDEDYFAQRPKRGHKTRIPIFIVGLPRSGSTLVEQILSSHSSVFAAGEINDISSIAQHIGKFGPNKLTYPKCLKEVPVNVFKNFAAAYMRRLATFQGADNALRSVDKYLFNYQYLGFISDLLPRSHIIHIRRHPVDTCLSCYFQNFTKGVYWSFDLEHIIAYYRSYRKMMEHWKQVLPMSVLDIQYENLIANPEAVSRQLLDFCGLPWQEECLNFHETKRTIKTASVWQVRQPIYQRSTGRYQHYQKHITQIADGLADYIIEYEQSSSVF